MAVVVLSMMYHNKMMDKKNRKGKKKQLITLHNKTKVGVGTIDQMAGTYTCMCKT